jgi:pseudouridine-5'-phosphate glycosidase
VRDALQAGRPVVALESTVITHGLPWPHNLELARRMEATVRAQGACPATIAVLGGEVKVGLNAAELEYLGQAKNVMKVSRRDYPVVVAQKRMRMKAVAVVVVSHRQTRPHSRPHRTRSAPSHKTVRPNPTVR